MKKNKDIKFRNFFFHNFALKILAVLFAVALWVVIVNIDNPSRTMTISGIQVVLLNENTLIDKGYSYAVRSGSVISISVKAPQTIVESLDASDFYAYADLGELSPSSDRTPIKVKCQKTDVAGQVDIVSLKTEYLQLAIDNKNVKDIPIEAEYSGNPAEGYVVGDCYVSPTTVTITGAETVVNSIAKAKVTYNINNMTQSVSEEVKISLYDENGVEVKSDLLDLSRTTGKINIEIYPTRTIPVNYGITGIPAEGYVISETVPSLKEITIAGSKSVIDKISSLDIPSDEIKTEGISKDTVLEIPLSVYLPSGCKIVSEDRIFTLNIIVQRELEINIPYDKINLLGCSNIYDYEIVSKGQSLSVKIVGDEKDIENITADDFYLSVSLSGKKTGIHTLRIIFEENSLYNIPNTYEIMIEITERPVETVRDDTKEEQETQNTEETDVETENTAGRNSQDVSTEDKEHVS